MIIVVGGRGFIGRHLTALCARVGQEIWVVSRTTAAAPRDSIHACTFDYLLSNEGSRAIEKATAVVYLATRSVPSTFAAEPWLEVRENVEPASRCFYRIGEVNPAAKVVLISSGGTIYGRVDHVPVAEDRPPAPISSYGLGKLMVESSLEFCGRATGLAYNILRLSNPVGVHQTDELQGIVPIALRAVRDRSTFKVFGDGSNVRDYLDADDAARAILAACEDRAHRAHVWNVGSSVGHSINEVISIVQSVTGRQLDVEHLPARSIDVPTIVLDSGRINAALHRKAERTLRETCAEIWSAWTRRPEVA
jgi:UDP-glucose 4-epimerase